jgi:glyoxylate/hydroxypyruvate reductase A
LSILLQYRADRAERWRKALETDLPGEEIRVWPDVGDRSEIEAVVTWSPEPGSLSGFPNLRFIACTGAGIDGLLDPAVGLPRAVPLLRLVDETLTASMAEYVLAAVLRYHRQFQHYEAAHRRGVWEPLPRPEASERSIGILGYGELGSGAARLLRANGFPVLAWSRTEKSVVGVESFYGEDGLQAMLKRTRILVCLLPLTPHTDGIIGRHALSLLPQGAFLINVARGAHVVDAELIEALDCGHLAHATLDVFRTEPLPAEHPFWHHPKITMTPHVASLTVPETAARRIADNLHRARRGEPLLNAVDWTRSY